MRDHIRLKYLCSSFSTPITQDEIKAEGLYPVFGASGIVGYKEEYANTTPYLGIIKDGAGVGRINYYEGKSSLLGTMAYIVPNKSVDICWLKYAVMALDLGKDISSTTIPHIYFKEYGNRYVPSISVYEQIRVARYLDAECSRIDSVIEKTRASIEEYKKLKQAVITQAVTKGIRHGRVMKDSGIEWVGEIPEDWNVKKTKFIADFVQNKYGVNDGELNYIGLENITSWDGQYMETGSEYDREQSLICEAGDILFGKLRPYLAKVYISDKKQCCSSEFAVLRIKGTNRVRFFWYQLISHGFIFMVDRSTYGTKMPRANAEFIKNIGVSVPSLQEQDEIIEYLDSRCVEMDRLIEAKKQLLTELEVYKKSLIYEYVTGKKEVPACQ